MATALNTHHTLDLARVNGLQRQLHGPIFLPGDEGYEDARHVWNGMIDRRPALVVRPAGVDDLRRAIDFARSEGLEISIKSGGHNVAGHAIAEGGMVLDMAGMRGVQVDHERGTARVAGGATWADVDTATGALGLATTGGVISTTGVAGLTLGGGVGWLAGKYGLSIDNLLAVEVVTADGQVLAASETGHPDLFWALRGGGGNFGVATAFEFQLHHQPQVLAGMIAFPAERAREVLEFYREFTEGAPDALTVYGGLMAEPESGTRIAGLALCWSGDLAEGERVLRPLERLGEPLMRMIGPMPYAAWQAANDPLFPHGRRYYWKGAMLPDLPGAVLDAMAEQAAHPPLPWMNATLEFYGGAMNRVGETETAFPHRRARYQALSVAAWDDEADDARAKAWARTLHAAAEPFASGSTFLNFVALDEGDRARRIQASFGQNWERLQSVKRRYDPDNVFHHNNTIVP